MASVKITSGNLAKIIQESIEHVLSESLYAGLDDIVNENELTRIAINKGFNLIGYHNTDEEGLTCFYVRSDSGIHFGSLKAANDRGKTRADDSRSDKYFLKVKSPLVIEKDFDWERENFIDWCPDKDECLDNVDIFAYFEKTLGWDIMVYNDNGEPWYGKSVKDLINEHGYDCIIYKNEVEDAGKYSIAMFEPNNIKLACETVDDNGKPIPLSQRFNTSTNDIRY